MMKKIIKRSPLNGKREKLLKTPAFIHIDIDGLWAIRECYGLPAEDYYKNDPVFEEGIPCFLKKFTQKGIPSSFFIVGNDAKLKNKAEIIIDILKSGHEIGNHSENHRIGLSTLTEKAIHENIKNAQDQICSIIDNSDLGKEKYPVAFRSPGYDINKKVLHVLDKMNFLYDTSLFPSSWGFLMRWIDAWISRRFPPKKNQYGHINGNLKSLELHRINGCKNLYEMPVSVSPFLRLPFHFGISATRGFEYFKKAADGFVKRKLPLVYLFHGIDFVETGNLKILPSKRGESFFKKPLKEKLELADKILDYIDRHFEIQRSKDWIARIRRESGSR
jgi:peptidoglycan-N-acetylglucosamine deacetylase